MTLPPIRNKAAYGYIRIHTDTGSPRAAPGDFLFIFAEADGSEKRRSRRGETFPFAVSLLYCRQLGIALF